MSAAATQDDDTSAKRLRILADASLGHGLSPTLGSIDMIQRPQQQAEHRREEGPRRQQPLTSADQQQRAFPPSCPAHSAPVERHGSGGTAHAVLGSASEGSPNAEGLSTGIASGTASVGAIGSRGVAGGAVRLHPIRPGGDLRAGAGDNRDGSPESKWAVADLLGSPRREPTGSGVAPPAWQVTSMTDVGGGLGRAVGLPPRPSEPTRSSSQELQTARSMSVDASTPRAHAAAPPAKHPLQDRLQTPEQREHARGDRAALSGGHAVTALQGGPWIPPLQVRPAASCTVQRCARRILTPACAAMHICNGCALLLVPCLFKLFTTVPNLTFIIGAHQGSLLQSQPAIQAQQQTLQQALAMLGARQQAVQQALAAVRAGTLLPAAAISGDAAPSDMSVGTAEPGGSPKSALQQLAAALLLPALASTMAMGGTSAPQLQQHSEPHVQHRSGARRAFAFAAPLQVCASCHLTQGRLGARCITLKWIAPHCHSLPLQQHASAQTSLQPMLFITSHLLLGRHCAGSAPQDDPSAANSIRVVHTTLGEVLRSRLHPGTLPNGRVMTVQLPPATPVAAENQMQQHVRSTANAPVPVPEAAAMPTSQHAAKLQPPAVEGCNHQHFRQGLLASAPDR